MINFQREQRLKSSKELANHCGWFLQGYLMRLQKYTTLDLLIQFRGIKLLEDLQDKRPEFWEILPEYFKAVSLPGKDSDILCGWKTSINPEQIMLLSRWGSKILLPSVWRFTSLFFRGFY